MTWSRKVVRRFVIHAAEAVAVVFAAVAILCGVVLWRMSQGPVDLEFLSDRFETALADAFGGDDVTLGETLAEWSPDDRSVVIVLADVLVTDAAGGVVAEAKRLEAGLSLSALLRGRVAFSSLEAQGGVFSIVRDEFGVVSAGLGRPDQAIAGRIDTGGASGLEAIFGAGGRGGLAEFSISSATLFIRDAMTGLEWRADDATLGVARDGDSLRARAAGNLVFEGAAAHLEATARASDDLRQALFEVRVTDLIPAAAFPSEGPLRFLSALDAPVQLQASAAIGRRGLLAGDVAAQIGGGVLHVGGRADAVRSGGVRASYDPASGAVVVDEFRLMAGATSVNVKGRIDRAIELLAGINRGPYPVRFEAAETSLDLRPIFETVLDIERVEVLGALDVDALTLSLERLTTDLKGMHAEFTGDARLERVGEAGFLPAVRLSGPITGVAGYRDVLDFWPVELADGARDYLVEAIKSGRVSDAQLRLDVPAEALIEQRLDDDRMSLTFAFDDAEVAFISTMSPLKNGKGRGELRGNSFSLELTSGSMAGMSLDSGYVEIPRLKPKGALARIGGKARGPARNVIAFIDEPPLQFPSKYGVSPSDFDGSGVISFEVTRPMYVEVPPEDFGFEVSGDFTGVSSPSAIEGLDVTDADVRVTANTEGLTATGSGRLGPAPAKMTWRETFGDDTKPSTRFEISARVDPKVLDGLGVPSRLFLSGEADLNVTTVGEGLEVASANVVADLAGAQLTVPGSGWRKPIGEPATARFDLTRRADGGYVFSNARVEADSVDLKGAATLGPTGRLEDADFSQLRVDGVVDAAVSLRRDEDNGLVLDIVGSTLDARGVVAQAVRGMGAGGGDIGAAMRVTARLDRALLTDTVTLRDIDLNLDHDGARMRAFSFGAEYGKGRIVAAITPDPGSELGARNLTASAPDAGDLVEILFGVKLVQGGVVDIDAVLPPLDAPKSQGASAVVAVNNFKLVGVPPLAQVLSLASLRGLADTLSGTGIAFDTLTAPMTVTDGVIRLDEARAAGSALGITVSGDLILSRGEADLDGVLVPAYSVNSALGAVPVLGDLLVSRKGEGVFALTYTIEGPFKETRVVVNPLSALAPGVLRRMFEGSATAPPAVPAAKPGDDESASN